MSPIDNRLSLNGNKLKRTSDYLLLEGFATSALTVLTRFEHVDETVLRSAIMPVLRLFTDKPEVAQALDAKRAINMPFFTEATKISIVEDALRINAGRNGSDHTPNAEIATIELCGTLEVLWNQREIPTNEAIDGAVVLLGDIKTVANNEMTRRAEALYGGAQ